MKETISALIIALAIVIMAVKAQTKPTQQAELLTPTEYAEYIDAQATYIEFLEGEISNLSDTYFGDVIIETDAYWDYQDATNKFYHIPTLNQ